MSFWRSCLNPGLLKYLVAASRSGPAISGVWNSNFPSQCRMLLLTLYMDLSILREPIQMVRCITGDLVCDKYGITCHPGEVCRLVRHFWLLVTASHTHSLVQPDSWRNCPQRLRTVVTNERILCFHIVDLFCGKLRCWLELIITLFVNFPCIRLLNERSHSFNETLTIHSALGTLDAWSTANGTFQSLSRTVWQAGSACYSWAAPCRPNWRKSTQTPGCVSRCLTTQFGRINCIRPN